MEQWREELYHSELYHYGVKGMKWGKHKSPFFKYSDIRGRRGSEVEKALGMYTENPNHKYAHNIQIGYTKNRRGTSLYLHNTRNNTYFKSGETNTGHSKGAFKTEYAEDGAHYSVNVSRLKRSAGRKLKEISDSSLGRAKSFISSRPSAVKKKVSEIKDKIAWAQKGKQTISSPFDSKPKKQKKSTITVEEAFPSKKQDPKKYQRQRNNYRNMYK